MNINAFDFILPTKIRFGAGIIAELEHEISQLGGKRVCLITDKGLIRAGIVDRILENLSSETKNALTIFDETEPNPRDSTVIKAAQKAKENRSDLLLAVGGGSSMDVAKAVSIILTNGGTPQDYEGLDAVKGDTVPLIAIPTTVGTGSEVTFWSVITDTQRHFKMSIGTTKIAPKTALLDPRLVGDLPASIVAATGIDALTHAIEGYTCLLSQPITDATGLYAIEMIQENIRAAVLDGKEEAKANLLVASLLAGICFGNADIASVHAMAEALGGMYDTPHGVANAILLPYVMNYNYPADPIKFKRIAQAMGEDTVGLPDLAAAEKSVHAVKEINRELKLPTLKDIGARPEDFPILAKNSAANVSSSSNVRKIDEAEYFMLFENAYNLNL